MRLFRQDEVELPFRGSLRLQEKSTYFLETEAGPAAELYLGARRLPRDGKGRFVLEVGFWAGSLSLEIREGRDILHSLPVEVQPHPDKLDAEAWSQLLLDLDSWLSGLSLGSTGGQYGKVAHGVQELPGLALGLLSSLPAIEAALRAVMEKPRRSWRGLSTELPIRSIHRVEPGSLRWLSRDARAFEALSGSSSSVHEPTIPIREATPSLEHSVNRFLAALIRRVLARLDALSAWLRETRARDEEQEAWRRDRLIAAEAAHASLAQLFRASFLFRLRQEAPSLAALLTVQDDPLYGRLYRLCRPFLAPAFEPPSETEDSTLPLRPTFDLYELWTFLALRKLLGGCLPEAKWSAAGLQRLYQGSGSGARFEAKLASGKLSLEFNAIFPSYMARGRSRRFSLSRERRPDLLLCWEAAAGPPSWICLDAKYRVGRQALAESFESAHIYRDALRMQDYGGSCKAAWLLVPSIHEESAAWFEPEFLDRYNTGAFCLRPGTAPPPELGARILESLGIQDTAVALSA